MSTITKRAYLYFPKSEPEKPIVSNLVRQFDLEVNIYRAKVTPEEEGYLSLQLTGREEDIQRAFAWLGQFDIRIYTMNKGILWDEARCTHCGNCVSHCPTAALAFADRATRRMRFSEDLCVECMACLANCPYGVCTSAF